MADQLELPRSAPKIGKPVGIFLGGLPCNLIPRAGWTFKAGVLPHIQSFTLTTGRALEIAERFRYQHEGNTGTTVNEALSLKITTEEETLEVRRLVWLGNRSAGDPRYQRVFVADRRILWQELFFEGSFNMRRRSGERRIVSGAMVPLEVAQAVDDVVFRSSTLENGTTRYTATRVLEVMLEFLNGPGGYQVGDVPLEDSISGVDLRGPAHLMLNQLLGYLPGLNVWIDESGDAVTFSEVSGEFVELAKLRSSRVGGWWITADQSPRRPKRIHVYRPRVVEVRWNYEEEESSFTGNSSTVTRDQQGEDLEELPLLDNVAPVPDATLLLASGRTAIRGEWVTIRELLDAWQNTANGSYPTSNPLTMRKVRKHYLRLSELHGIYTMTPGAPDLVWGARINTIQEHYRRTFRIRKRWMGCVLRVQARRVALIDPETGTLGRSEVFCDYVVKPSARGLGSEGVHYRAWEVAGYADELVDAKVAPFDVRMIDPELGIFSIVGRPDAWGKSVKVAPGSFSSAGPPVTTAGDAYTLFEGGELDSGWKCAVVLSVIQDSPNDLGRLHRTTVDFADACAQLPGDVEPGEQNGVDVHVFDGVETARFGWLDDFDQDVYDAIRLGQEPPEVLMVNPDTVYRASLARAAQVAAGRLDRAEGTAVSSLTPGVRLAGSLQKLTHEVVRGAKGVQVRTVASMEPVGEPENPYAFMPASVRAILKGDPQ